MKKSVIKLLRNSNRRRKKLTAAVLLLTTVIICFALPPKIWGQTADTPNIIFILTDDQRLLATTPPSSESGTCPANCPDSAGSIGSSPSLFRGAGPLFR